MPSRSSHTSLRSEPSPVTSDWPAYVASSSRALATTSTTASSSLRRASRCSRSGTQAGARVLESRGPANTALELSGRPVGWATRRAAGGRVR